MNAVSIDNRPGLRGHHGSLVTRYPLAARIGELVLAIALYALVLAGIDILTGKAILPVAVTAMLLMPIVFSIALRLGRTLNRRYRISRHLGFKA